jgi:hypothetical protein
MMKLASLRLGLKVGDAVWIATARLHQRNPNRTSFDVAQIVEEVKKLGLTDREEISIYVHANQHCVANRPPNPAKLRMLFETEDGGRRLFRSGDRFDHKRDGRLTPKREDLPDSYLSLLDWYDKWCIEKHTGDSTSDALLALRGTGRALWADEHADEYVENLRSESL